MNVIRLKFLQVNWQNKFYITTAVRTIANKANNKAILENEITKNSMAAEWNNALPYETIPGPSRFSTVARFLPGGKYYQMPRINLLKSLFNEYGDIVRIIGIFGRNDIVFIRDPNNFEKVYRTESIWPNRHGLETLVHYRTVKNPEAFMNVGGLLAEQNEAWANFRSIVNPVLMQPRTVKIYTSKMDKVAGEFVNKIREIRDTKTNEVPGTFQDIINLWTLESVSVVALDTQLGLLKDDTENHDAKKLIKALSIFFSLTVDLDVNPSIWRWIKTPKYHQLMKGYDDLTDVTSKYINEALNRYEKDSLIEKSENEKSVLERLLKHDKKIAVVMATDMLMAGVDTTTTGFSGCLLALAKNPEKQKKLRKEIMTILPTKDTPLTTENMKNLPYLRACIKEGLRVHPVTQGNMRATGQNLALCGYQVPKGIDILMIPEYENTEFEFDKPSEFIPERWLRTQHVEHRLGDCPIAAKPENPFTYLPFGFGPRSCIGKRIVEMELETAIAKVIRNFNVEFNYPADDIFTLKLIFVPAKELKFKFTDITE